MMKVYHFDMREHPGASFGEYPNWPEDYELVADVDTDSLGEVFRLTNSIDHPWMGNAEVYSYRATCRSTSVGDVVVTEDGKVMRCEHVGWKKIGEGD